MRRLILIVEKNRKVEKKEPKKYYCGICGVKEIWNTSENCIECRLKSRRKVKNRPSIETLEQELQTTSYVQLGKKYGVCDNTIRKWMRKKIIKPNKKQINSQEIVKKIPKETVEENAEVVENNAEENTEGNLEEDAKKNAEVNVDGNLEGNAEVNVDGSLEGNVVKVVKKKKKYCGICGINKIWNTSKNCKECDSFKQRKVKNRPSKEQLLKELQTMSYVQLGKKYGVSDNTIRKWLR